MVAPMRKAVSLPVAAFLLSIPAGCLAPAQKCADAVYPRSGAVHRVCADGNQYHVEEITRPRGPSQEAQVARSVEYVRRAEGN